MTAAHRGALEATSHFAMHVSHMSLFLHALMYVCLQNATVAKAALHGGQDM